MFDKCVCDFGYHFSTHGCAKGESTLSGLFIVGEASRVTTEVFQTRLTGSKLD